MYEAYLRKIPDLGLTRCPLCKKNRRARNFKEHEGIMICLPCHAAATVQSEWFVKQFGRLDTLCNADCKDVRAVAAICRGISAAIGDQGDSKQIARYVGEFMARTKLSGSMNKYNSVTWLRLRVHIALLNAMVALDCLEFMAKEAEKTFDKSLQEYSDDELRRALIPLATQLVNDNPHLAVRSLQEAGYKVWLKRPKKKKDLVPDGKPDWVKDDWEHQEPGRPPSDTPEDDVP